MRLEISFGAQKLGFIEGATLILLDETRNVKRQPKHARSKVLNCSHHIQGFCGIVAMIAVVLALCLSSIFHDIKIFNIITTSI